MTEIIPAILARDEEEFRRKLEKLKPLGLALHIDIMDGEFVPEKSWAPADAVPEMLDGIPFDAHLMVANPEHAAPMWIAAGARTVIFHAEATPREALICRATAERCSDLSLAVNPDTPVSRLTESLHALSQATVMGVTPGRSGQEFQDIALEKIRALKAIKPSLRIIVDGGVKPENARAVADAGADAIVVGSAITDQDDAAAALARFTAALA